MTDYVQNLITSMGDFLCDFLMTEPIKYFTGLFICVIVVSLVVRLLNIGRK